MFRSCGHLFVLFYSAIASRHICFFFLMIRRPPRSTLDRSSAASDVYKRQVDPPGGGPRLVEAEGSERDADLGGPAVGGAARALSLIHISEPTRPY